MEEIAYQTRTIRVWNRAAADALTGQKGQKHEVFSRSLEEGQRTVLGQEVLSLAVDELVRSWQQGGGWKC